MEQFILRDSTTMSDEWFPVEINIYRTGSPTSSEVILVDPNTSILTTIRTTLYPTTTHTTSVTHTGVSVDLHWCSSYSAPTPSSHTVVDDYFIKRIRNKKRKAARQIIDIHDKIGILHRRVLHECIPDLIKGCGTIASLYAPSSNSIYHRYRPKITINVRPS